MSLYVHTCFTYLSTCIYVILGDISIFQYYHDTAGT